MGNSAKNEKTQKKVDYVCDTCGSDNVQREGVDAWSVHDQQWVSVGSDDFYCNDCGNPCALKEVEVDA